VLVLINGRPFRDALGFYSNIAVYNAFPVDLIERVEIVRGPGSVLYGSGAIAGVINIVTREAEKPASVSVSGGGGSFGGKMASGTALFSWHDAKLVVGGNYFNEDGWDYSGKTKIGTLVQDSSMPYGEDNRAVAAFLEYKRFRAQFAYMDMTYADLGIVPVWAAAGKSWSTRWFADLGYTQPLMDGWSAGFNVTRNSWDKHILSVRRGAAGTALGKGEYRGRRQRREPLQPRYRASGRRRNPNPRHSRTLRRMAILGLRLGGLPFHRPA
jgi:outer membrane receptor protein involved in Fe transport